MPNWKKTGKASLSPGAMVIITLLALGAGFFAGVRYADSVYLKIQRQKGITGMNLPPGHPDISASLEKEEGMNYPEAIQALEAQLKKKPGDFTLLVHLANLYSDSGQFTKAVNYYEKALKLHPEEADVWVDYGVACRELKQPRKAIACFQTALARDSAHPIAWYNLGVVYQHDLHNTVEANKAWQAFLKIDPNSPLASPIQEQIKNNQ
jgi:tetratricopeptide (TPR) repeat protein